MGFCEDEGSDHSHRQRLGPCGERSSVPPLPRSSCRHMGGRHRGGERQDFALQAMCSCCCYAGATPAQLLPLPSRSAVQLLPLPSCCPCPAALLISCCGYAAVSNSPWCERRINSVVNCIYETCRRHSGICRGREGG